MKINTLITCFLVLISSTSFSQASGIVFVDANNNGVFDISDKGLSNVLVSNGVEVVKTNTKGEYTISVTSSNPIFIIKPKGYITKINENSVVQFFANNVTENQKEVNFSLYKNKESKYPKAVLLGDPQADVMDDIHHVGKLVTEELVDEDFDFMVPLGDLSFDNLKIFQPLSQTLGLTQKPVFYTIGNHDVDFSKSFNDVNEEYEKHFGPSYYAFEYGDEFFLVLNNIYPLKNKKYEGRINENQYQFIQNILKYKQNIKKLTVFMHIPLEFLKDKNKLINQFSTIKKVFIVAGHTHTQYHKYFSTAGRAKIHELVAGAVCGAWWQGPHDIQGIPFALMNDGTRKGYWFLQYTKDDYTLRYKVSGASKKRQMEITVPEIKEWDVELNAINEPFVFANVFAADANTEVSISFDNTNWQKMNYHKGVSPKLKRLYHLQSIGRFKSIKSSSIPKPTIESNHLWRIKIPKDLPKGPHLIRVKAINSRLKLDVFGCKVFWKV